jgi:hypothetical protein
MMVLGAFALILGGSLIAFGPILATVSFYKMDAGLISSGSSGGNFTSIYQAAYQTESNAVNQAEIISLLGVALAPIGGAILVYGVIAAKHLGLAPQPDASGQTEKT